MTASRQPTWRDAERAVALLAPRDLETLLLLARLPLLPVKVLAALLGLAGPASLYRQLVTLRRAGLVAVVTPALGRGRAAGHWHLTDLGLAAVGLAQGVEPARFAQRYGLRERDLLALLAHWPVVSALYIFLGGLVASRPTKPELVAWERPWRRTAHRPQATAPVTLGFPAAVALSWSTEREAAAWVLLPDLGRAPTRAWRRAVGLFLDDRAAREAAGQCPPPLLIATAGEERLAAWTRLLADLATSRGAVSGAVRLVDWDEVRATLDGGSPQFSVPAGGDWSANEEPLVALLRPHPPARVLPRLVGSALGGSAQQGRGGSPPATAATSARTPVAWRSRVALGLTEAEWTLLDLLSRHPFLSPDCIAPALGWRVATARRRLCRLRARELLRLVDAAEVGPTLAARELAELTVTGLALAAAWQGLSLAGAVRWNGLAGGGPGDPVGTRRELVATLDHTLGADACFIGLHRAARRAAQRGGDDALVVWRNAAACCQGAVRPDGYGLYRQAGQHYGCVLEYDRGTMRRRHYGRKFTAYGRLRDSGRYERDYQGFPTILIVTTQAAAEARIAAVLREVSVGRAPLPALLTTEGRIRADPAGMLGPVWREAHEATRRHWLRR